MRKEFDKSILFDNIAYLLKENDMKVGELETKAGVSVGYISRTKEGNAKPGIDFIMKAANILKVSLDTLLTVDLRELTPTEKYLITFIVKLIKDTNDDKLDWNVEKSSSLNRLLGIHGMDFGSHPLFNLEKQMGCFGGPYPEEYETVVFNSKAFGGLDTVIEDDCYNLAMKNGATLYVMTVGLYDENSDSTVKSDTELWMTTKDGSMQYLCRATDEFDIGYLVIALKSAIQVNSQHPKIKKEFRTAIDAFLTDNQEDDDDTVASDDLPF